MLFQKILTPALQGIISSFADFSESVGQRGQEFTEVWLGRLLAHTQVFKHPTNLCSIAKVFSLLAVM